MIREDERECLKIIWIGKSAAPPERLFNLGGSIMKTDRIIKTKNNGDDLYTVEYYNDEGKRIRKKSFNASKYGEENAKWMAEKWLELHCEGECLIEKLDSECHIYVLHETKIHTIICDIEYYDEFSQYKWHINNDNNIRLYAECNKLKTSMHRLVTGVSSFDEKVDHINHNCLDNRKSNLRIVSNRENQKNLSYKSNNTSGIIGVRFNSQINCWQAQWRDNKTNKQCIKSFNIKKYGDAKAKQMAIEYRKKMEKENGYLTGN